ncbi:MAG: SPOR domain-containing protein [Nitrospirae bacterium]|nr:SPOR domain-containing protein [Nitrospirota bacterium]
MRGRVTDRSSILLLGRNTVIIGAVVVTVISFGLGYFFGYKGTGSTEPEKQVEKQEKEIPKAGETQPEEEKKVLEASSGKESPLAVQAAQPITQPAAQPSAPIVPPTPAKTGSIKPPEPIPEVAPRKSPEASKTQDTGFPKGEKTADSVSKKRGREDHGPAGKYKSAAERTTRKKSTAGAHTKKKTGRKIKVRKPAGEVVKKSSQRTGSESALRSYTVQMGAFPTREGAEQLQQSLKAKGYKPYIAAGGGDGYFRVRVGSFNTKKDAERSAAELSMQTGLQNFVTIK